MICHACACSRTPYVRDFCPSCFNQLPELTRRAYRSGFITTRQAIDALRTRTASIKTFGGGRKRG